MPVVKATDGTPRDASDASVGIRVTGERLLDLVRTESVPSRSPRPGSSPAPASAATGNAYRDQDGRPRSAGRPSSPPPPRELREQPSRRRARIRDWRVRWKLTAVVLVPTLATVALAGTRIAGSVGDARTFSRVAQLAQLGRQVTVLVQELQNERDLSAGYAASTRARNGDAVQKQRGAVDNAVDAYRSAAKDFDPSYSILVSQRMDSIDSELSGLDGLRSAVDHSALTRSSILAQYSATIEALLDLDAAIADTANDRELAQQVQVLDDLSRAKEFTSQVRAQLYGVLDSGAEPNHGSFAVGQFQEYVGATAREQSALDQFQIDAPASARALFADKVRGKAVSDARSIQDTVARQEREVPLPERASDWYQKQSEKIALMRQVETTLLDDLIALAKDLRSTKQRDGVIAGLELLAVLLAAFVATIVTARAMTKPLRILRTTALDVADHRLPAVIERLRQADAGNLDDITVTPTGIDSRDEIGEVAQAFDAVHREAVRLAVDQASLRQSVNAMFVNLSRRSQGLVERQLRLIDELESSEQNPDQLENLFKLDHLATRMRRTDDSLLVLAGSETGRGWNQPMSLPDVLLAAISEVEQYTRITRTTVTEVALVGYVVSDVVHLLAELMENATAFSPPETTVTVSCRKLSGRGGAMIEIEDHGIGMTAEELETANARLAAPPVIDVAAVRTMGLFVVGRLANKHNIRVQLRNSQRSGLTALVLIPPALITDLNQDGPGEPEADSRFAQLPGGHDAQYGQGGYGMQGSNTDTGPQSIEPSPIFDSVSEWFRHRRRIDHDAVQDSAVRAPQPARPPAPPRQAPPPPQAPVRPPQAPGRGMPQQPQQRVPQPPRDLSMREMPQPPAGPPAARQQQPPQRPQQRAPQLPPAPPAQSGPPQAGLPRRGGPVRRPGGPAADGGQGLFPTAPPAQSPPSAFGDPGQQAGQADAWNTQADTWNTPADEGWRAAEATSKPSYERMTAAGLPVRTPRAHLFPGSAATDRQRKLANNPASSEQARSTSRTPDSVRSVLSTYYSSYRRGRTGQADPGGRHRANFGPLSPNEQEGS
jgi:signal transduction histidine kinase